MFLTSLMSNFLLGITCQWLNMFQYTLHISYEHDKYEVLTIFYRQSATSSQPTQEKVQPQLKWSRCHTWLTLWYLFHFHIITTLHTVYHMHDSPLLLSLTSSLASHIHPTVSCHQCIISTVFFFNCCSRKFRLFSFSVYFSKVQTQNISLLHACGGSTRLTLKPKF